jgi:excisionase family DNA binding protein
MNKTKTIREDVNKYLRVKQAAEYLGVSQHHVYRLAERRLIPHYKSRGGKVLYFLLTDLEAYITDTYVTPQSELNLQVEKQLIQAAL